MREYFSARSPTSTRLMKMRRISAVSSGISVYLLAFSMNRAILELTAEILRIFIKRVEVSERAEKYSRTAPQEVRIYYRDIGLVDELPKSMADSVSEEIPNEVA